MAADARQAVHGLRWIDEEGYTVEMGSGLPNSLWIEGLPEYATFLGMSALKTRGKAKIPVESYRCEQCGLLKSYAPQTSV